MLDEVYLGPQAMFLIEGLFPGVIYMGKSRFGTWTKKRVQYRGDSGIKVVWL